MVQRPGAIVPLRRHRRCINFLRGLRHTKILTMREVAPISRPMSHEKEESPDVRTNRLKTPDRCPSRA
jgi:hypothetical protein